MADEKALIDQYNKAVNAFNTQRYADCRAELQKLINIGEKFKPGDPEYNRAVDLLKRARAMQPQTYEASAQHEQRAAQDSLAKANASEAVRALKQAIADMSEWGNQPGKKDEAQQRLAQMTARLSVAELLQAVLDGKAPDTKLLAAAPTAKHLSSSAATFSLPRLDQPKLLSSSDYADDGVLVIHLMSLNHPDSLVVATLGTLRKRLGSKGLNVVTVVTDGDVTPEKLAVFIKEQSVDWPVALDDLGEFRAHYVRGNYYLPSFVVVGRDRQVRWISLNHPEDSCAGLCRAVEEENARKPEKRPRGPVPFYQAAEEFSSTPLTPGSPAALRFGQRPALIVVTQASDRGDYLKALATIAAQYRDKLDVFAVADGEGDEALRTFAKDNPFPIVKPRSALPACYGPSDRFRLVLISPRGNVLKVLTLSNSAHYLSVFERYAALLTTPSALPAELSATPRPNIANRMNGGNVESASDAAAGDAAALIDGKTGHKDWEAAEGSSPEIVLSFRGGQGASFDRIWLDNQSRIRDVEFLASTNSLQGTFRSLGQFRLEDRHGVQAFAFTAATAKYLKVRLLNSYEAKERFALGEIGVEEAGAASARTWKNGFQDEFAQGRLSYWQQVDVGEIRPAPVWKIESGKLLQPHSPLIEGFDHRCTALLHAYRAEGDFRFQAKVTKPNGQAAGLIFGFQDWDNFDCVLMLEAQVLFGKFEGNSIRLERRRGGKAQMLSIHGESFDRSKQVQLEVIGRGNQLVVKAQDRVIMTVATEEPLLRGRVGLFTAGASDCKFEGVRLTPQSGSGEPTAEINPLSTAAGATIVWLSGQGNEHEPQAWAANLLRDPVFSAPGAWITSRKAGQPPEVVFAFRDARTVTIEEVAFVLPTGGNPRDRARRVEVLVARDCPLKVENFQSAGVFELADKPGPQSFRLAKPQIGRFLMVRLLENNGGDKFALARVTVRQGAQPKIDVAAAERSEIERSFVQPAAEVEKERHDTLEQATSLTDGREMEAIIRPGEVDMFRLPDPPAKKGRATLRLQMAALPWLRINATVLDASGKSLDPPLAKPEVGQLVRQTRPGQPPPRFVRVEMPRAAISAVLDNSGSMAGRENDVRTALKHFLDGVSGLEEIEVLRFASEVTLLAPFTNDPKKLAPIPNQIHMNGATALYQAMLKAMEDLAKRDGNRAIFLLSDGMNTIPGEDFSDLCRRLRAQPLPIYVVGVGWDLYEYDGASGNTCADLLRNLALMTGGQFFYAPTSGELEALYRQIASEMRGATRYRLLAHWEVVEQHVELATTRSGAAVMRPYSGGILPSFPELAALRTPRPPKPMPYWAGSPPAGAELQDVAIKARSFQARPLPLPALMELAAAPGRDVVPTAAILPLPVIPELAAMTFAAPAQPLPLGPLPEFGRLAITYVPGADSEPLPPAVRPALELILDCSGSMEDEVAGVKKYIAARRVLTDVLKGLPDEAIVGFRVFGRMAFWDPSKESMPALTDKRFDTDTELIVGIAPLSMERRKAFQDWINYLTPKGETPLVYSLLKARKDFPESWKGPKTVVLISDGMETRGGKLADVEKAYAGDDLGLIIHVVGFDVQEEKEQEFLKAVARIGRGRFFNAKNADQLGEAVTKSLQGAAFDVRGEDGKPAGAGIVNGPALDLESGSYTVRILATKAEAMRVRIGGGKTVSIKLTHEGKLALPVP
jgi:Mg-chelatase subunit ChlD